MISETWEKHTEQSRQHRVLSGGAGAELEGMQPPGVTGSLLGSAWQLQLLTRVLFPPGQLQLEVMGMHGAMTNLV